MHPLVSVVVPVYNGEAFVREAIESILAQQISCEIIVIDDGSTDGTPGVLQTFGDTISYERQTNQGPAAARNRGLRRAQADLIAFLDADDIWPNGRLGHQLSYLEQHSWLKILIGRIQCLRLVDAGSGPATFEPFKEPFATYSFGSSLFRRSAFDEVGEIDEELRQAEDFDWFMRAREQRVELGVIPEITLFYRYHGRNITLNKAETDRSLTRALKQSLDRRRASGTGRITGLAPMPELSSEVAASRRHASATRSVG